MKLKRRRLLAAGVASAGAAVWAAGLAPPEEEGVPLPAREVEFTPAEITLEKGVPVVLELTSDEVTMGFYAPEFKADLEIIPGQVARLRLVPDKVGTFEFICDVFCGEGHEDMTGKIHVT